MKNNFAGVLKSSILSITLLMLFGGTTLTYAVDVTPSQMTKGTRFVQVTTSNQKTRFEDCLYLIPGSCRIIGARDFTVSELRSQQFVEGMQVVGSVVGDFAALWGGLLYVGVGAATLAESLGVGALTSSSIWLYSAAATPIAIGTAVDALNPYEQYKQLDAISDEVILDSPLTNDNIANFINRLTLVLNKL